ncbi:MAG: hypothetical protein LBU51_03750 [Bacteroidales bacterium]|jgi:hypothetical protein|nr:hypothetical protein [Bacteroidales bacterium]
MGNTAYFGDPMMTGQQYLMGIAGGAIFGGITNGITALANGRSFWNGNLPTQAPLTTPAPTLTPQQEPMPNNPQQQSQTQTPQQKGQEGVNKYIQEEILPNGGTATTEVTLEVNVIRVRVDIAADFNGEITLIEVKNGPHAGFTPNQKIVYPQM